MSWLAVWILIAGGLAWLDRQHVRFFGWEFEAIASVVINATLITVMLLAIYHLTF